MSHGQMNAILLVALAVVVNMFSFVQADAAATCHTVTGMSHVNATLLAGDWYEVIRAPGKDVSCVQLKVDVINNQTQLNLTTNYSGSKNGYLMDKHWQATVNISDVNANDGFNVSHSNFPANTTYKILSTDYNSSVVLCGYTNASDPSTSFGLILTRHQMENSTRLMHLKSDASQILAAFNDSSAANITQSNECHTRSATNLTATCQAVTGMSKISANLLAGDWYEVIRAPGKDVSCVQLKVDVINNQTQLNLTTNYSGSKNGYLMDKHWQATVNISDVNANDGFNVSHSNFPVNTTYKILSTDYNSSGVLCGYTNASDPSTSYGVILTRQQKVNSTHLMQLKSDASQILAGFNDSTAANITQSNDCHTSSAATFVPALGTLFTAFYALLKLAYEF